MKKSYKPSSKLLNVDILMQTFALNMITLKKTVTNFGINPEFMTVFFLIQRERGIPFNRLLIQRESGNTAHPLVERLLYSITYK